MLTGYLRIVLNFTDYAIFQLLSCYEFIKICLKCLSCFVQNVYLVEHYETKKNINIILTLISNLKRIVVKDHDH